MKMRELKDKAQRESEKVADPNKLWTIESVGRRQEEAVKSKKQNEEVCRTLDQQLSQIVKTRQQSRETDINIGR